MPNPLLQATLFRWYDASRRNLPWRQDLHPYRTWVSEIMLQQTRVEAVIEAFQRFTDRFPDLPRLAEADLEEVLALWSGLGYYRRARLLHQGARYVMEHHNGELPRNLSDLRKVPGIGPYTCGAILSIAYGIRTPLVDGNVERVLTRLHALEGNPRVGPLKKNLWKLAEELVPEDRPGDFNQALMELGALICVPRSPRCPDCPWRHHCKANQEGTPERFPQLPPRKKSRPQLLVAGKIASEKDPGSLLCFQRGEDENQLAGLWELPTVEILPGENPTKSMVNLVRDRTGLVLLLGEEITRIRHSILDRSITLALRTGTVEPGPLPCGGPGWGFLTTEERSQRGFSSMYRKALEKSKP